MNNVKIHIIKYAVTGTIKISANRDIKTQIMIKFKIKTKSVYCT